MVAETDVVNVALRLIGANPITSLTDGTEAANTAADLYDETRDQLLASHNWNFATKRVKLAQSSTDPAFEFDHAYPLPSDWIRTISVHDNDAGTGTVIFRHESVNDQNALTTSADDVYLRYVARIEDPNRMSADFRRALAHSLARDMSLRLTSSNTIFEQFSRMAQRSIAQARSSDAQGSFPERRPVGSWVTARGGRWPREAAEGD